MRKATQQLLLQEIADWRHRGLIDAPLQHRLGALYERPENRLSIVLQWLGIGAVILIGMAVLGGVSLLSESLLVGAVLFFAAGAGLWLIGTRLARDPAQRLPVTGVAIITIGLILMGASLLLGTSEGEAGVPGSLPLALLVSAALSIATAYGYRLRWPLLLGLLCLFHGLGSWERYGGHGSYFFDIQDPRSMAPIAALTAVLGLWHQHAEQQALRRFSGFGRLYVIFGLLYLNCSLWFLSLDDPYRQTLTWTLLFTLGAIAQLVIGARFQHPSFTGFAVVFLGIDLYTRFYEYAWDHLSAAAFFAVTGLLGLVLGWLFERTALRAGEVGQ